MGFRFVFRKYRLQIPALNRYFHISDQRQENKTDKFTKIRTLISKQNAFENVYVPGKNISIDEGLIKFNGRLSFKQYMPKKPNKFGIKVWMLADSETYFVPRFQIYLGEQTAENADENDAEGARGLGFKVVDFLGKPRLLYSNICLKIKLTHARPCTIIENVFQRI